MPRTVIWPRSGTRRTLMARMLIDSLVIELGLDPTQFTKGQRQAMDDYNKMQQNLIRHGKAVEDQGKKVLEVYTKIRNQLLNIFAAVTAGMGIAKFIEYNSQMASAVGRASDNLNMQTRTLSAWRNMAVLVCGTAEGM